MTRLIFLDIDGTLTDGKIYYSSNGEEEKAFNIKDGLVISAMIKLGYIFVVVTGRKSSIVDKRMSELGVDQIFQGVTDKDRFITEFISYEEIDYNECCYIGDDFNDIKIMSKMGIKGCPFNACTEVREMADIISDFNGGDGAVRQILENILKWDGKWEAFLNMYIER